MAGDLFARLRLAKYKVRTGQAHVPFTQLEAQLPRVQVRSPSPERDPENTDDNDDDDENRHAERDDRGHVPLAGRLPATATPIRALQEDGPPSSVLRGGAASGLLRLSQGTP